MTVAAGWVCFFPLLLLVLLVVVVLLELDGKDSLKAVAAVFEALLSVFVFSRRDCRLSLLLLALSLWPFAGFC